MTKAVATLLFVGCALGGWLLRGLRDPGSTAQVDELTDASSRAQSTLTRGAILFQMHCAKCHGAEGHGDTEAAARLPPPPRDFAARPWRFEATPASIERVTREGVRGTSMPASPFLSDDDVSALVTHVLQLSKLSPPHGPATEVCAATQWPTSFGNLPARKFFDAGNKVLTLDELRGSPVIVHIWGMSCATCLREMPGLEKLTAKFADQKLRVLHVCVDSETAAEAEQMLDRVMPGAKAYVDARGLLSVSTLPTTYLIAADGRTSFQILGACDWESQETIGRVQDWLAR